MKQDLVINLVPIELSRQPIAIYLSAASDAAPNRIGARHVGGQNDEPDWSWDLQAYPGSSEYQVSPTNFPLVKRIIRKSLCGYLRSRGLVVSPDFIERLHVLQFSYASNARNTDVYKVFRLRVVAPKEQHASQSRGWHISVTYDGETEVYRSSFQTLHDKDKLVSTVVSNGSIRRVKDLARADLESDDVRPVVSARLRANLGLSVFGQKPENKYKKTYDESVAFYSSQLKGATLGDGTSIYASGFQSITEGQVILASQDSNLLVFGQDRTHFNPYNGLKDYGPFQNAPGEYKFFFIFHKDDADYANRLYSSLNKGLRGFPGLQRFVGLELHLDRTKTIIFQKEDPTDEIVERLKAHVDEGDTRFLAIYISRIKKDESDESKRRVYHRVKGALLERNITSQVVYRGNIDVASFHYFLPNIAVAMLAKLGGVPWRLSRPIKHDLIVGLGAFREDGDRIFLGTTVAFRNDGTFIRFNAARVHTVEQLVEFFRGILATVPSEWPDAKRLVIHFYKSMNRKEEAAISAAMDELGIRIPYVVLNIVEDVDLIPFDLAYSGLMPSSGTCVTLRRGDYLLCNNTRYSNHTGTKIDDFPLPIRIRISKASMADLPDDDVKQLVDEAYQFSRMYWVSVRQKSKPVTVLYSERVATFSAAFPNQSLPQTKVATTSLWFL
jgi:hypothetical protein